MLRQFYRAFATLFLCAVCQAAVAETAERQIINFGIISTESSQNLRSVWQPFLHEISRQTGYEVKAFFASDYAGIVQGMRFGKVDLAWYGNKSAMEAVDRASGEVFAQTISSDGQPGYWSLLIVNKNSPLQNLDDMFASAGQLVFGNGDPNSTSGYLVPGYYVFARNQVNPAKAFKRMLNSSHEVNALAVANGQIDVATCNTEALERLRVTHPAKAEQIRILWKSPLIPSDPLVWRKDLPETQKKRLKEFFFGYGADAPQQKILADLQWAGFRPSDNDQLLPIRQLELFKRRSEIAANASINGKEKAAELAAIDEALGNLEKQLVALQKSK